MIAQEKALEVFGIKVQTLKLAEECAELAAAALHILERETPESLEQFFEECGDVEIVLESIRLHYGDANIDAWRTKKLTRLEKRLGMTGRDFSSYQREQVAIREIPPSMTDGPKGKIKSVGPRCKSHVCWVDGNKFNTINKAAEKYGRGIYFALKEGRDFKGHTVSLTPPPEARA